MPAVYTPAGVRLYSTDLGLSYLLDTAAWSSEMNLGMRWRAHIPQVPSNIAAWEGARWYIQADAPDNQADWTSPPLVATEVEIMRGSRGRGIAVAGQCKWSYDMETKNQSADALAADLFGEFMLLIFQQRMSAPSISYHETRPNAEIPAQVNFNGWNFQLLSVADHLAKILAQDAAYWISTGGNRANGLDVYQMEHRYSAGNLYIGHSSEPIARGSDLQRCVIRRLARITNPTSGGSGTGGTVMSDESPEGIYTRNIDNYPIHGYSIHAIDQFVVAPNPGRIKWFAFYDQLNGNVTGARVVKVVYPYPEFDGSFTDWPAGQVAEEPWRDAYSFRYQLLKAQGPAYNDGSGTSYTTFIHSPLVAGIRSDSVGPVEYAYPVADTTPPARRILTYESATLSKTDIASYAPALAKWMLRFANRDYYTVQHDCRFDPHIRPGGYIGATDNFPEVRVKRVECNLSGGNASMACIGFKLVP